MSPVSSTLLQWLADVLRDAARGADGLAAGPGEPGRLDAPAACPAVPRAFGPVAAAGGPGCPCAQGKLCDYGRLLDRIAGASPEILYVYDFGADGIVYINEAVRDALGRTPAEVVGLGSDFIAERLHPDHREAFAAHQQRLSGIPDGAVAEAVFPFRHENGSWHWLRLRTRVLSRKPDGTLREILGSVTDVTDHHRAQEALRVSEARYRTVSELTSDYSFSVRIDPDGRLEREWITEAFSRITGYEPEELSTYQWERLVHPDDHAERRDQFERAIRDGQAVHEYRIRRRDGDTRWIREHARVILNDDGSCHWYGACQDITEQKLAETARALSDERFHAITEGSRDIVVEIDRVGNILYVSPNVTELTGYTPEFLKSEVPLSAVHPDDAELAVERFQKMIHSGEPEELRFRICNAAGEWRWMETTATLFRTGAGDARAVMISRDITERLQIEGERRRLASVVESSSEFIAMLSPEGRILFLNEAGRAMVGLGDDTAGRSATIFECLVPEDASDMRFKVLTAVAESGHWEGDIRLRHRESGRSIATLAHVYAVAPARRAETPVVAVVARDISERITAERLLRESREQLLQVQKLEAVGRLAGGVAHDFNNLLTAITGYGDLLLDELDEDDPLRGDAEQIVRAAERAAGLTRQLLAFSRRQVLLPKVLDLNALVADVERLLRRLIGEDVELIARLDPRAPRVRLDPGQLEQLVMNLAINARDAMPRGGRLTITTSQLEIPEGGDPEHPGIAAGPHALLRVEDTGVGMTPEVLSKVFEPFYTTKDAGKGTGLGLAMSYGIVQQSGGEIRVASQRGAGSAFSVYLPRVDEPLDPAEPVPYDASLRGSETVLLVEDSDAVRTLVRRALCEHGYSVLDAGSGDEALACARAHAGPLDLLVTDVVMPQMDGHELAQHLAAERPDVKVLFMSGFSDDVLSRHGVDANAIHLIQKPFAPDDLLREMRRALGDPATGRAERTLPGGDRAE